MKLNYRYLLVFFPILFILGCLSDAPRDNPLESEGAVSHHSLKGTVHTYYAHQPRSVITGATLTLLPVNMITTTDQDGSYQFDRLNNGDYRLISGAPGFNTDTVRVQIPEKNSVDFYLDGLPFFKKIQITTHHISRWFPAEALYFLEMQVTAGDTDGVEELSMAWCQVPEFNVIDTLQESSTPGIFNLRIYSEDFNIGSLHHFIGKEFVFYLKDNFGETVQSSPQFLTRIIETSPSIISPTNRDTVSSSPFAMQWQTIYLPFSFSLAIEIFNISAGITTKVDEFTNIPSTASSFNFPQTLSSGEYYWTISIVDEFGNRSRSKEGAFIVP